MFQSKFITLISLTLLIIFVFSALQLKAQEVVKVVQTYSPGYYGPIEVKVANEDEWEPLRAGIELTGDDWIRMPPASLLRLEPLDGGELPTFTGGQMRTVAQFLLLAKDKKPSPTISPTGKSVSIGAMPKGTDVSEQAKTKQQRQNHSVTEKQLQQLLALVPEHDEKLQGFLQNIEAEAPYQNVTNLGKSLWIFDQLQQLDIQIKNSAVAEGTWQSPTQTFDARQGNEIDYALLYYALLKIAQIPVNAVPIPASLELPDRGLYLNVNSNVPRTELKKITVNSWLVEGEDHVWIPLYITPSNANFAQAWYKGAIICQKIKAARNYSP